MNGEPRPLDNLRHIVGEILAEQARDKDQSTAPEMRRAAERVEAWLNAAEKSVRNPADARDALLMTVAMLLAVHMDTLTPG